MDTDRQARARNQALELSRRKDAIEAEMDAIHDSLTQNNGPGLQGNLVDAQGFPRADIDIVSVRQQRQRLAVLKNDHSSIMAQLQNLMHLALPPQKNANHEHPSTKSNIDQMPATAGLSLQTTNPTVEPESTQTGQSVGPNTTPGSQPPPRDTRVPFALVDSVAPQSPSANAGLQVNDRIVAIGAISLRSFSTPADAMSALPGLLSSHENVSVDVIVQREDSAAETITLCLIPRRWSGRGLLGCHVVPLEVSQVDSTYAPDVATMAASRTYPAQP